MRLLAPIAFFLAILAPLLSPVAANAAAPIGCQFVLGFKALHDLIPDKVGDCKVDVHYGANGDGLQETTGVNGTGGLLAWRKADNWTAYTDGYRTWINGPLGLQLRLNTDRFPWEPDWSRTFNLELNDLPTGYYAVPNAATVITNEALAAVYGSGASDVLAYYQKLGRIGGYYVEYGTDSNDAVQGLASVSSEIAVYTTASGAHGAFSSSPPGTPVVDSSGSAVRVVSSIRVSVPPLGDESQAAQEDIITTDSSGNDVALTGYNIEVRKGRFIIYFTGVSLPGSADLQLATKLIQIVLGRLPS